MNRTRCVARVAWCVFSMGAVWIAGASVSACTSCAPEPVIPDTGAGSCCGPGTICLCDTGATYDVDVPDRYVAPPECVGGTGTIGDHCRAGACAAAAATCLDPPAATLQSAFMLRQAGDPDPLHDGFVVARAVDLASDDAPFNGAEGSLCAQRCDPAAAIDACGACASCSGDMTQAPLVAAFGGARAVLGTGLAGLCRIDCTWSPTSASLECPTDMACDPFGAVCIEACTTDNECNTGYAASYQGELLTSLETAHPRHCNTVTGRCEASGTVGAHVGDPCEGGDACAPGAGLCLSGGHCAELGCPTPNTATSTCDGGRGICLTTSDASHPTSICLMGCTTSAECGPGNACSLLHDATGAAVSIGPFAGYCVGVCASDDECIASEACTDTTTTDATGATVTVPGRCVPRCTGLGGVGAASGGCASTEQCVADHAGAAYGHCAPADDFCGAGGTVGLAAASSDCATGWVCDELLAGIPGEQELFGDGHCTPACTSDGDCTALGRTCVTSGTYAGLCRHACSAPGDCAATETCSTGWCVER